ncbi:MAG: SPFH domain-containing protein [Verrucomicrobiota bacterium]|nr:SPFH domain-containing protein [Verrucomicrobiota bacterium]
MNRAQFSTVFFLVLMLALAWLVWEWGFCRFYVPPDHMAIITAKSGDQLPAGQILAKRGQKGVWEDVLGEGRHFLNPILYNHLIVPVTVIPPGRVGIVTSKVGKNLPPGEFLANDDQKGIWRRALGPGKYRLNSVGYKIDIVDAVSIPIGYAGVITSLSGEQALEGQFAKLGQKGVRQDILQPGLYYINPSEFAVHVLEIGVNQISFLGKTGGQVITKSQIASGYNPVDQLSNVKLMEQQEKRLDYLAQRQQGPAAQQAVRDWTQAKAGKPAPPRPADQPTPTGAITLNQFVNFPSRDGFDISLDMTVEFELLPKNIAWIYRSYGDLPAVLDKVINPQILSASRLKGSAYGARDFIVGEGREKFQTELAEALSKTLAERKILVHSSLIRHVNVPDQILEPIQEASVAVEQDLTNKEKQNTARKQAELNTEMSLIDQRREQVAQETDKIKAEIRADQEKTVAETQGETLKLAADIAKQTAQVQAEKATRFGKADADVVRMVEGEKAKGFQLKVEAFGDPTAYNLWTFARNLNPDVAVNILHAGDGTLWTDLEKARLGDLGGAQAIGKKGKEDKPAPAK